jgi:hypothetical protein
MLVFKIGAGFVFEFVWMIAFFHDSTGFLAVVKHETVIRDVTRG